MTKLSIIIVNYNSAEHLKACLLSIRENPPDAPYEVIVSDNASSDGSLELIKRGFPEVKLIENEKNLGFPKATNKGIKLSTGEYIFVLNTDTILFKDTLNSLIAYMESNPDVGAVGPKLVNFDGTTQPCARPFPTRTHLMLGRRSLLIHLPYFRKKSAELRIISDKPVESDIVAGGALLLRKKAIDKVGNFDERFFLYMEDVDICRRLKAEGWKVIYNPMIKILHYWEGTTDRYRRRAFLKHHISIYKYFQKYEPGFFRNLPLALGLVIHYIGWSIVSLFEKKGPPKSIENGRWK